MPAMDVSSQDSVSDNEPATKATPVTPDEVNEDLPSEDEEDARMPIRTREAPKATVEDVDEDEVMKDADTGKKITVDDDEDDDEEDDDDDDVADNEYVVEKILNHQFDDKGTCFYEVKWKGYEKKSDRTWEPISNLEEGASEILNEYHRSIGGKPIYKEKARRTSRGTKTATPSSTAGKAKGRKGSERAPSSSASVSKTRRGAASAAKAAAWTAPKGSWEEHVQAVDTIEQEPEGLFVYLQWNDGRKSRHPMDQIYVKCPMKMLYFYEQHLVFKEGGGRGSASASD